MDRIPAAPDGPAVDDRSSRVEMLWQMLGGRPDSGPPEMQWTACEKGVSMVGQRQVPWQRHDLLYRAEPEVSVPAWILVPPGSDPRVAGGDRGRPAVLYLHSHSGDYSIGRNEALLGKKRVPPGLAPQLLDAGFTVFAADFRCFGERSGELERESARWHLLQGTTLWGRMLWDQVRALDLLETLPGIDSRRIGCFGFSMGSTAGWWLAALDRRIAAGVGLCCLSTYRAMARQGVLQRHGIYYFVPRAATIGVPGLLSLIAPRPFLFLNGDLDETSPVDGARDAVRAAGEACRRCGSAGHLCLEIVEGCGHEVTPAMIHRSVQWLTGQLDG